VGCQKSDSLTVSNLVNITIFKIAILFIGLGNLMTCTHDLIVLTKIKEMTRYCGSNALGGKSALINASNDLTHVSVPVEDGQIIPIMGISHHPYHMSILHQCSTGKHKQPNNITNRKEIIRKS
jgi:hypothetical protein